MMLRSLIALPLVLSALAVTTAQAAPSAPENAPDFLPVAQAFFENVAAGRVDEAAAMTDYRGMATYLVSRRMEELKRKDPDMLPEEEEELAAGLRMNEVSDERLQTVVREMIRELNGRGMQWDIKQVMKPEKVPNAVLISYVIKKAGQAPRPAMLGLQKIGPQWYFAPHLMEQVALANAPTPIDPPPTVVEFGNFFWTFWQNGELDRAHALFTDSLKERLPILPFLENGAKLTTDLGPLSTWKLTFCGSISTNMLSANYDLAFAKGNAQANIGLVQTPEGWRMEGFQLQRVQTPPPGPRRGVAPSP